MAWRPILLLAAAAAKMEPFDFVQEHWVEIEQPLNGQVFPWPGAIAATARVRYAAVPALRNATSIGLSILVAGAERTYVFGKGEAVDAVASHERVSAFCLRAPPLEAQNCAKLRHTIASLAAQLLLEEVVPEVCFTVSDGANATEACSADPRSTFAVPRPGRYTVSVKARGALGVPSTGPRTSRSVVTVDVAPTCARPVILRPRHGAIVGSTLRVELDAEACVSIHEEERCGRAVTFFDLVEGRAEVRATTTPDCTVTIAVDVRGDRAYERPRLLTAASERYVSREMLNNLVGSLQFWEPGLGIVIYDLGFTPQSRSRVGSWNNVKVRDLAPAVARVLNDTPPHALEPASYAFKMLVIADMLLTERSVLWIDANCELRRPLDGVFHRLHTQGHFLVEHPYRFPTAQFHHPDAVRMLGCAVEDFSRQHCATTFVGVVKGSWFDAEVLPRLIECMRDPHCVNPVGSSRSNNRQEQTALNAILCALNAPPDGVCSPDKAFRLTADFENDLDPMQPTRDETDWNSLSLYTRRDHAIKPYLRFLRTSSQRDEL
jgi:hypothetical protein